MPFYVVTGLGLIIIALIWIFHLPQYLIYLVVGITIIAQTFTLKEKQRKLKIPNRLIGLAFLILAVLYITTT